MKRASEESLSVHEQPVLCNTDIAELLLVNRSFVLECWPAEEYSLKNGKGKTKTKRSLLTGALVRTAATGDLAQIVNSDENRKGRRVLELQGIKQTSIHDIMDHPWPEDHASKKLFEKALHESLQSRRIADMSIPKVAATLHRLEQAKYWSGLKQKHSNRNLAAKQRSAIEGQMADCMRSTEAPPAAELLAMVQAGCEEEEPGEVSEGRRALQKHLQDIKARQQGGSPSKVSATAAQPGSRSAGPSPIRQHAAQVEHLLETYRNQVKHPTPNASDGTASSTQRRPASATPRPKSAPSSHTSNASLLNAAAAKHAAVSPQLAALQQKARHEPVVESPGIITSATISRLAPNFAAQQPVNGRLKVKAPGAQGTASSLAASTGKRKSAREDQAPTGSGHQPITFHLHPAPSEVSPSAKSAHEGQLPTGSGRQPIIFRPHPPPSEASPSSKSAHEGQFPTGSGRQPITFHLHPAPSEVPPSAKSAHEGQPPTGSERQPITFHLHPAPSEVSPSAKSAHEGQPPTGSGRQPIILRPHPPPSQAFPNSKSAHEGQPPTGSGRQPITFHLQSPTSEASPSAKSAHKGQPPTGSGRQPITFHLHPALSEAPDPSAKSAHEGQPSTSSGRQPITFRLQSPTSEAPVPSASSPGDQSAAGRRKKIKWDPEAALAQQIVSPAEPQAQEPALVSSVDSPISCSVPVGVPVTTDAPSATGRSLNIKVPLSFNPTASPAQALAGHMRLPQNAHQNNCQRHQHQQRQADAGGSAATEQEPAGLKANLAWSWGPGAAVGGQFAGALINVNAAERASGVLTNDAQLPFSYVLQPEQQPELASTTCTAVSLVQCEGQSFSGWSKPVPLAAESISGRGTVSSPEGSKFDAVKSCLEAFAVKGCVEHGRLWGILEASGAALALCTSPTTLDVPHHDRGLQANDALHSDVAAASKQQHPNNPSAGMLGAKQRHMQAPAAGWAESGSASQAGMSHLLASLGVSRSQAPFAKGSATQLPAEAAAQSAPPGSSQQQMPVASASSMAADSPCHLAILLVAAAHLQPWLSATRMSQGQLECIAASCAASSPAIYAMTLYTSDPALTPARNPSTAPEEPSGPSTRHPLSHLPSDPALPHPASSSSSAPGWFVPVSTILNNLRPPANKETGAETSSKTSSSSFSPVSAADEHKLPSLSLPAAVSGTSSAMTPVVNPQEQCPNPQQQHHHQRTSQQHGQAGPDVLNTSMSNLPSASASASVPQHGVSQSATEQISAPAADNRAATTSNSMRQQGSRAAEEELSSGRIKAKQSDPVGKSQLQQQADTSTRDLLQQSASGSQRLEQESSDMSISSQPGISDQPPSSEAEAMDVSPASQQPTEAIKAASALQGPGQSVPADLGKGLPQVATPTPSLNPNPARSDDVTAVSGSLPMPPYGSAEAQLQHRATIPEPPTRGKRSEHEDVLSTLAPAAAQLMSGKPKPQGAVSNSPLSPSSAAASLRTGNFGAARSAAGQPAMQRTGHLAAVSSDVTKEAATAAAKSHLPVGGQAREGSPSGRQASLSSPPPAQASAPSRPKQKRNYRQPTTEAEASPEAKRLRQSPPAQQTQVKQEPQPPMSQQQQHHQQQQRQQVKSSASKSESRKVREPIRHPEQPIRRLEQPTRPPEQAIDLATGVVPNILRSIRKLQLQGHGQNGQQELSTQDMDLMTHLPPLVQLRILSKYATEVMPYGNVVKFFSLTVEAMGRKSREVRWLTQRDETATAYRLCDAAVSLYGRLGDCGLLPEGIVPVKTPQLVPLELQAAYVLSVGGHIGSSSHKEFADQLMIALLDQVCLMMVRLKASPKACETAETNLLAAGGLPAQVHERFRQPHPSCSTAQRDNRAAEPPLLTMSSVREASFAGMICLNHLKENAFDAHSMKFLTGQDALWQLRIMSCFAGHFKSPQGNASAFLTSVCKNNRNDKSVNKLEWLRNVGMPPTDPSAPVKLHPQALTLLDQANKAGVIPKDRCIPASIVVLPRDWHCVAACYVVGVQSSESSINRATYIAELFVRFAQGLIREVDTAAVLCYSRAGPETAAQSASQPQMDDQSSGADLRRSNERSVAAAAQTGNPNLIPLDPRRQHSSQPPHPQTSAPGHQGNGTQPFKGTRQDQSHAPPMASHPHHCRYYYRIDGGCTNRNCTFYHGSHEEYVAYMVQRGLVPYSLKFVSDVGRDRWIVDGVVDALNDMIISHQLPRGSLGEYDLRPLAFLEDPRGGHAQMQLQVVQRMAEHGPTPDAVGLLQRTCHDVQAQAQPGSGGHPAMSEGYGSRGTMPMPEESFAGASSSLPQPSFASAHMFGGPADFAPSSSGMAPLPLSLPFAPEPLPSQDQAVGDIPFPVLRYEEELVAGLILLQHEAGAVNSVDQLLTLQPQCAMPNELGRHFRGDMRDRVLSFLQTRPWLFGVDPHGPISVTRLAREGLIYKRDVITYLYNAFTDSAPHVALAEINECVPQPPSMQQVMMENNGLLGLMDTQLFRDDVMLQPGLFGPQDVQVVLRSSGI